jgi:hypothetical protein
VAAINAAIKDEENMFQVEIEGFLEGPRKLTMEFLG